jgi:hypothetical protein
MAWFAANEQTLPECVRELLAEPLAKLQSGGLSKKAYGEYGRQLARALGLIPSSERRRTSGRALDGAKGDGKKLDRRKRDFRAGQHDASATQKLVTETRGDHGLTRVEQSTLETDRMTDNPHLPVATEGRPDLPELSPEKKAEIAAETAAFVARAELGDGEDPSLAKADEALMNADVVCVDEDAVVVPAELPECAHDSTVVKTLMDSRVRYDFAVTVTELTLHVEKKVVVGSDGTRRVFTGNVQEFGPKGFAVTWQALATLAVMVGQFAMPLHRLGTMLSSATKRFTATSLSRMAHYVAERLLPIYLTLMEQLADSDILAGDDTSCRVLEVSTHRAQTNPDLPTPWQSYATVAQANEAYLDYERRKAELLTRRFEGDREAKVTPVLKPPLKVCIARELPFESPRKSGAGPKQSLNTTVVTGRTDEADPQSTIVFYRSHLGSLGNLLEMLLARRKAKKRKLIVQADLATTNLVTDPQLTSRFDVELVGCGAHARRPFAQYEDQDPKWTKLMLALFAMLAVHEDALDRHGRNRENTLAVRGNDSRKIWERIKRACTAMAERWTKATPLGAAVRYVLKHFDRLTVYLDDPRLDATNNLRERLLRTEKLIEKSSMFRKSIEGRAVLDILRTILQTAVAAGAPPHAYLIDVLKASPADIEAHPEHYTPAAWAKRSQAHGQAQQDPA